MRARWKKLWDDNSGFSLVELLIVIAIMSILLGMVTVTIAVVNNSDVNKATRNFTSVVSRARTESMAKGTEAGRLTLLMENGVLYYWLGDAGADNKEMICNSMINVGYSVKDPSSGVVLVYDEIPDGTMLTVRFATTGFVIKNKAGEYPDPASGMVLQSLIFTRGDRKVAAFLYTTGKTDTRML